MHLKGHDHLSEWHRYSGIVFKLHRCVVLKVWSLVFFSCDTVSDTLCIIFCSRYHLYRLFVVCVTDGYIVDFDFHVSTGFIYWSNFVRSFNGISRKLNVHRIKPDSSDYADVVSVSALSSVHNISALAINWVEGMLWEYSWISKVKIVDFLMISYCYYYYYYYYYFNTLGSKDPEG